MARPLRMDYPDTFYHVLSRGNEKRNIFYDGKDYLRFLEILGKMVERFNLEIHAYVLMKNHYHLLIRTREANLSRAIQWLGVSYSVWFNRRHERSGHLFQGRFKSFLIENERYFTAMCFYIHGNPLRAGFTKNLWDYPWSSYRTYIDRKYETSWLKTELVLGMYGGNRKEFFKAQEMFLKGDNNIFEELWHGLYLGSEKFGEECIERARREEHREKPQGRSLLRGRDLRTLALEILGKLDEKDPQSALKVHKYRYTNRDVAIYILYQLGVYRNEEIGEVFGIGYTAVTGAVKRAMAYLNKNLGLEKMAAKIINDI
ncbi:MAG: transposase [Syntrophaceae bacterium]|nr:transposase [Syntrophaceae bacterium]